MNVINAFSINWWQWMGSMLWQVGLLIGIISIIDFIIRKWAWPQVRYALWLLILLKLVLPPTWSSPVSLVSHLRPKVRPVIQRSKTIITENPHEKPDQHEISISRQKYSFSDPSENAYAYTPASGATEGKSTRMNTTKPVWQTYALLIWVLGIFIVMTALILRMMMLRRWHDQQNEKSIPTWFHEMLVETASYFQLSSLPAIVFHKQAKSPAVYGLFRPVMLLPANYFDTLSKKEAKHVLLHELAHLKRGDLWLHGLCLLLQIIYWFNPLLIWVRRQTKHVREICCDLTVANILKEQTMAYRQTLLNTAREMLTENMQPGLGLLGVFEDPFRLVTRLKWLERNTWRQRKLMLFTAIFISITLTAAVIPMAAIHNNQDSNDSMDTSSILFTMSSSENSHNKIHEENYNLDSLHLNIQLKRTEPFYAAVLPMSGPETIQMERSVHQLELHLKKQKIKPGGPVFGRYISDPEKVDKNQRMWEVGVPVKKNTNVRLPLQKIHVNAMQVAFTSIQGIMETEKVWDKFIVQLQNQGLIPCFPPAYEIWTSDSKEHPFWWNTELQIQAFRPDNYPHPVITYKESDPITAIILPVQGPYYHHPEILEKLSDYMKKNKIKPAGSPFGMYYSLESETQRSDLYWEVGIPVAESVTVEAPFEIRNLDTMFVASTVFQGSQDMEHPWSPFVIKSVLDGYFPHVPAVEIWNDSGKKSSTELQIGVIKIGNPGEGFQTWAENFGEKISELFTPEIQKSVQSDPNNQMMQNVKSRSQLKNLKDELYVQTAEPAWLLTFPVKGTFDQVVVVFEKLDRYIRSKSIVTTGPPIIRQYNAEPTVPVHDLRWDAAYMLGDSMSVEPPFEVIRLHERQVLQFQIKTDHNDEIWKRQLSAWLFYNNYRPVVPHHLFWTYGLLKPGKQLPSFKVQIEVIPVTPAYNNLNLTEHWEDQVKVILLEMIGSSLNEEKAIAKLNKFIKKKKIIVSGPPFVRYIDNAEWVPENEVRWQVGYRLDGLRDLNITQSYKIGQLQGGRIISTQINTDSLEISERDWIAFILTMSMNGYTPKGYPIKRIHQMDKRPHHIELCWTVN